MKIRRKIVGYVVSWIWVVIFTFFTFLIYEEAIDDMFIGSRASFYLGIICGMCGLTCVILLIDVITPIVKFIKAKIHKSSLNFIDILLTK